MCRLAVLNVAALILLNGAFARAQQDHKHEVWADEINAFHEQDEQRPSAKGGIVFVGDSDVVLCDLEKWFPDAAALNRGFGGAQMDDVVFYLNDVLLKHEPAIVVLSCGGNDIAANDTPDNVHKEFQRLVAQVFERLPSCRLLVTAQHTPPLFADKNQQICRFNDLVKRTATNDERLTFLAGTRVALHDEKDNPNVDLFRRDRLHFNNNGYRKWTRVIAPKLKITE
jgi:lysophospholipase L1-like esterase